LVPEGCAVTRVSRLPAPPSGHRLRPHLAGPRDDPEVVRPVSASNLIAASGREAIGGAQSAQRLAHDPCSGREGTIGRNHFSANALPVGSATGGGRSPGWPASPRRRKAKVGSKGLRIIPASELTRLGFDGGPAVMIHTEYAARKPVYWFGTLLTLNPAASRWRRAIRPE
jgi:hypothetical protein